MDRHYAPWTSISRSVHWMFVAFFKLWCGEGVANKLKTVFCLPCNFFEKVVTTAIPSNHDATLKWYGVQKINCHFFTFSCCFKPVCLSSAEQREYILNVSVFLLDAIQVRGKTTLDHTDFHCMDRTKKEDFENNIFVIQRIKSSGLKVSKWS